MLKLGDIWLEYCQDRLGELTERTGAEPLTPARALELLWTFFPMFSARDDVITATPYSEAFDAEADSALAHLALTDSLDGWEGISTGAWRVLRERLLQSCTMVAAGARANVEVMTVLPRGLDRQSQARALLLRLLLSEGRTIDRRLLGRTPAEAMPTVPGSTPLWRQ